MPKQNSKFQFKQFTVSHETAGMKIGTDAVLLGALLPKLTHQESVLDIGTGTGILALMLAQKSNAKIIGIELDEATAQEAQQNCNESPWHSQIKILHQDLQNYQPDEAFDLIISNPPYFQGPLSGNLRRDQARHLNYLPLNQLLTHIKKFLKSNGSFWGIVPTALFYTLKEALNTYNLHLHTEIHIHSFPKTPSNRVVFTLTKMALEHIPKPSHLTIRETTTTYTLEYQDLLKDYLIIF